MSSKLNRLVHMDAMIRSGTYPNVIRFVEIFEVSKRTVFQDIAFLKDSLNAPIQYSRTYEGYYYFDATWVLPASLLNEQELLTLFLGLELTRQNLGTDFGEPLGKAIKRMIANLPEELRHLDVLARYYSFSAPGGIVLVNPDLFLDIQKALLGHHPFEIVYHTRYRDAITTRIVYPYRLHNAGEEWQLIGYDNYRQAIRTFALQRIQSWKIHINSQFELVPDAIIDEHLASQFSKEVSTEKHEFVIWFDRSQALNISERTWPSGHREVENHEDGSITLRFTGSSLNDVRRWVLGFGSDALVLEPLVLKEMIYHALVLMKEKYESLF